MHTGTGGLRSGRWDEAEDEASAGVTVAELGLVERGRRKGRAEASRFAAARLAQR